MVAAMPKPLGRWLVVALYCGLIFYLSSLPSEELPLPPLFWWSDKVLHALEYAVLSFLLGRALGIEGRKGVLIAVVIASLYGHTDEFHQSFVPGREATAGDWLADTVGAALVHWRGAWRRL